MRDALTQAFLRTDYLVCLDPLAWPCIRIGQALPAALQAIIGRQSWAFITAWNAQAQRRPDEQNQAAQRALLDDLNDLPEATVHAAIGIGIGVGASPWYEPSLFAIGPALPVVDVLARRYRQKGFVYGSAGGIAQLHLYNQ